MPAADAYRCPAGERLTWRLRSVERGKTLHTSWSSHCPRGALESRCTTGEYRRIQRWEHEAVLETVQERLDGEPEKMRLRRQTVEHPFGTLKACMGYTHFLTGGFARVTTEMRLHFLAYNLKWVINILAVRDMKRIMSAAAEMGRG